jgi:hypothetical protein
LERRLESVTQRMIKGVYEEWNAELILKCDSHFLKFSI